MNAFQVYSNGLKCERRAGHRLNDIRRVDQLLKRRDISTSSSANSPGVSGRQHMREYSRLPEIQFVERMTFLEFINVSRSEQFTKQLYAVYHEHIRRFYP